MSTNYDELAVVESNGSVSTLLVTGIDQTYDDLHVIFEGFVNDGTNPFNNIFVRLNQDSNASNYSTEVMINDNGSSLFQQRASGVEAGWTVYRTPAVVSGNIANWAYMSFDINNYTYAGSRNCVAQHHTVQQASGCAMGAMGMSYFGTAAVTAIEVTVVSALIGNGSTLSIYGINNS